MTKKRLLEIEEHHKQALIMAKMLNLPVAEAAQETDEMIAEIRRLWAITGENQEEEGKKC